MTQRIKSNQKRLELSESAFETHEALTECVKEAIKMSVFADAIGMRRTAGQLRSAASLMMNAKGLYVSILREGYRDRHSSRNGSRKR